MELDRIKDKIRKLLALSGGTASDNESYVALQKAQALMAEYKLSEMEVSGEPKSVKCVQKKTEVSYGTRSADHFYNDLATVIADNFCCVNYLSTPRGTQTNSICFMGSEEDVEIAAEVLYVAKRQIIKGYNEVYKELCREYRMDYIPAKYFNPAKVGYVDGYIAGLKKALADQKEQHQEWGLVLVTPTEATDFIKGLRSKFMGGAIQVDTSYYDKGYNDGAAFQLNKKISGKEIDVFLD